MDRSGRIILVGTLEPWTESKGPGDQIWAINRAYPHQPNLDRLYLMDPMPVYFKAWGEEFVDEINALGVPIMLREPRKYIPNGVQFNWRESFDTFSISFFGATVANAIANAMEEGAAEIVLHKMYLKGRSQAYLHHKAAIGFWVGQAVSAGIVVTVDPDCFIPQHYIYRMGRAMEGQRVRRGTTLPIDPLPPPPLVDMILHEQERQQARKQEKCSA